MVWFGFVARGRKEKRGVHTCAKSLAEILVEKPGKTKSAKDGAARASVRREVVGRIFGIFVWFVE